MSFAWTAAAIVGSSVVSGVMASKSADKAAKAAAQGADAAAAATIETTGMQIEEIRRQFDYQQQILLPQVQQQFNAQRAYADILGFGGPDYAASGGTAGQAFAQQQAQARQSWETAQSAQRAKIQAEYDEINRHTGGRRTRARREAKLAQLKDQLFQLDAQKWEDSDAYKEAEMAPPVMGGEGSSNVARKPDSRFYDPETGAFRDPNIDPTKLAENTRLRQSVEGNRLAGTSAEADPFRQFVGSRKLAAGAAGRGVYGEQFTASPGYSFQREEMERQLERVRSAGGPNIGGRAVIEAQRRAQGLAAGDYYNWAAGRERDLGRLGGAEATDISREDNAYLDYLRRREGDVTRLDTAASAEDRLRAADLARSDQSYYNYLEQVARQAGFGGGSAATAVNASQAAGGETAGAYRQSGANLASTYSDRGASQANIEWARGAAINNAVQSGVSNYITAGYAGMPLPGFGGSTPPATAAAGGGYRQPR